MRTFILFLFIGLGLWLWRPFFGQDATQLDRGSFAHLQNGDLIFQTSTSGQSEAIQLATNSIYSHVGIVYEKDGAYFVFEAVNPVRLTPITEWIDRGKDDHFVVKRLHNAKQVLTPEVLRKMQNVGERFLGKPYDLYFEWSDERIYCSELVWKIYKEALGIELGKLERLGSFDLSSPVVKAKMRERYGSNVSLEEWVITPAQVFKAEELITVESIP